MAKQQQSLPETSEPKPEQPKASFEVEFIGEIRPAPPESWIQAVDYTRRRRNLRDGWGSMILDTGMDRALPGRW
ncbi:uncharacterized protein RSE6_12019 [Rhynchosporium secalis]|uniref:Uncharacterized protein n=1 Tax=Rhynchosporium secalis TaxID=38038 RepID=A0A1E1MPB3_RHYSE|nr:uncharacterized protein RSE6_12019 [Rhynchosporium secalis]